MQTGIKQPIREMEHEKWNNNLAVWCAITLATLSFFIQNGDYYFRLVSDLQNFNFNYYHYKGGLLHSICIKRKKRHLLNVKKTLLIYKNSIIISTMILKNQIIFNTKIFM